MRALLILLLVPATALGLAVGATNVVGRPTPAVAQTSGFVWAHRVFSSGHDLDGWLRARGSSYDEWAGRHPKLAASFPLASRRTLVGVATEEAVRDSRGNDSSWWNILLAILAFCSAITVGLYVLTERRPGIWRELGPRVRALARDRKRGGRKTETAKGSISTAHRVRPEVRRATTKLVPVLNQSLDAWQRGWAAMAPRLAHVGPQAVEHSRAAASATRPLRRRIRRRYLPRLAFYAASVVLAFAIGAAISTYLN